MVSISFFRMACDGKATIWMQRIDFCCATATRQWFLAICDLVLYDALCLFRKKLKRSHSVLVQVL